MHARRLLVAALVVAGAVGIAAPAMASSRPASSSKTIIIGSQGFTEDQILADIYNDVLVHAGLKTHMVSGGTRAEVEPAFAHGQIDLYPDYAGSLLLFLNSKAGAEATQLSTDIPALDKLLAKVGGTTLTPAPAIDTNVFAVTKATADKDHLTTLSSLKPYASRLTLGGPSECQTYYYCEPGLKKVYKLHFANFVSLDEAGPISIAGLKSGRAQVVEFFSTDGAIAANHFVELTDNLHLQPADHVVPVIKKSFDSSKVASLLNAVSKKLTTSVLTQLNVNAGTSKNPAAVATNWLKSVHLT